MSSFFNFDAYYRHLKTKYLGRPCIFLDRVESTIDVADRKPQHTIVLAREQLNGRGQRTNIWHSPVGCAMGSIRLACTKSEALASRLCFLQHIMVIVAAKTLEQLYGEKLGKDRIGLKWPNDIIYTNPISNSQMKIGGVLVHTVDRVNNYDITLSFGLNVFNSKPTTCVQDIIGNFELISMESLVANMLNSLEEYTYELNDEKFYDLKLKYIERCLQMNKLIEDETNGMVKIIDVNDDGYLVGERCSDQKLCTVTKIVQSCK